MIRATSARPVGFVRINRGSPLTNGLIALMLPGANGHEIPEELVSGRRLSSVNVLPSVQGDLQGGSALLLNASDAGVFMPAINVRYQVPLPLTMLLGCTRLGTMGANVTMFGGYYNQPQTAPFVTVGFSESNVGVDYIGMYANNAGTIILPSGGMPEAALPLNEYHIWIGVWTVNNQLLFRDSVQVATGTVTHSSITYTSTSTLGFGDPETASRNPNLRITHAAIWNRTLNTNEIRSLSDPLTRWDLYATLSRRSYFLPSNVIPINVGHRPYPFRPGVPR